MSASADVSRALTGCLDRAFSAYSARRHGPGPTPGPAGDYGAEEEAAEIPMDEFDDELFAPPEQHQAAWPFSRRDA